MGSLKEVVGRLRETIAQERAGTTKKKVEMSDQITQTEETNTNEQVRSETKCLECERLTREYERCKSVEKQAVERWKGLETEMKKLQEELEHRKSSEETTRERFLQCNKSLENVISQLEEVIKKNKEVEKRIHKLEEESQRNQRNQQSLSNQIQEEQRANVGLSEKLAHLSKEFDETVESRNQIQKRLGQTSIQLAQSKIETTKLQEELTQTTSLLFQTLETIKKIH